MFTDSVNSPVSQQTAKIAYPVEGLEIRVVEILRAVIRGSALKEDVVAVDQKIHILERDLLRVVIAAVEDVLDQLPLIKVLRADERQQIAQSLWLGQIVADQREIEL